MDLYSQIAEIVDALRDAGETAWADLLANDVQAGSTGTEILMAVRWHLRQVDDQVDDLPGPLIAELHAIVEQIGMALGDDEVRHRNDLGYDPVSGTLVNPQD